MCTVNAHFTSKKSKATCPVWGRKSKLKIFTRSNTILGHSQWCSQGSYRHHQLQGIKSYTYLNTKPKKCISSLT